MTTKWQFKKYKIIASTALQSQIIVKSFMFVTANLCSRVMESYMSTWENIHMSTCLYARYVGEHFSIRVTLGDICMFMKGGKSKGMRQRFIVVVD